MRAVLIMLALVLACQNNEKPAPRAQAIDAPVATAHVTPLAKAPRPVIIVWVADDGALAVTHTGVMWAGDVRGARTPISDIDALARAVAEARFRLPAKPQPPARDDDAARSSGSIDFDEGAMDRAHAAREKATEDARAAGVLEWSDQHPSAGGPGTLPATSGDAIKRLPEHIPLIIASPHAPAIAIARIVGATGGMLAVSNDGKLGVLDLGFGRDATSSGASDGWFELLVGNAGLAVVDAKRMEVANIAWRDGLVDRDALAAHFKPLEQAGADPVVDILATNSMTVQQLVDVLSIFAALLWTEVALGETSVDGQQRLALIKAARHEHSIADRVAIGMPNKLGEIDRTVVRNRLKTARGGLVACYDAAPAGVHGTVQVTFTIKRDGHVTDAMGDGVERKLAACIADAIAAIAFPKPTDGHPITVAVPIALHLVE